MLKNSGLIGQLKVKFRFHDFLQIILGATILAIPVGLTEETWKLGEQLPLLNIMIFVILSVTLIAVFTYYHYHSNKIETRWGEFLKRTISTYVFSFLTVGILLALIHKAPWTVDFLLAFKRTALVTFPASMSGAVADLIK